MSNELAEPTDEQIRDWRELADHPEAVWRHQESAMPDTMKQVDTMLRAGASPEWIISRGEFQELAPEIQTVFINALHWRQTELRKL